MNPEDFLKQEDEEETLGVVEPLEVPSEALSEEPVVEEARERPDEERRERQREGGRGKGRKKESANPNVDL